MIHAYCIHVCATCVGPIPSFPLSRCGRVASSATERGSQAWKGSPWCVIWILAGFCFNCVVDSINWCLNVVWQKYGRKMVQHGSFASRGSRDKRSSGKRSLFKDVWNRYSPKVFMFKVIYVNIYVIFILVTRNNSRLLVVIFNNNVLSLGMPYLRIMLKK